MSDIVKKKKKKEEKRVPTNTTSSGTLIRFLSSLLINTPFPFI